MKNLVGTIVSYPSECETPGKTTYAYVLHDFGGKWHEIRTDQDGMRDDSQYEPVKLPKTFLFRTVQRRAKAEVGIYSKSLERWATTVNKGKKKRPEPCTYAQCEYARKLRGMAAKQAQKDAAALAAKSGQLSLPLV